MVVDTLRKMLLVSIGALTLTKEKAEQLVKELSEKGEVSQGEARGFIREVMERGDRERQAIRSAVAKEIRKIREEVGWAPKRDLARINERLRRIEEHLDLPPLEEPDADDDTAVYVDIDDGDADDDAAEEAAPDVAAEDVSGEEPREN